MVYRDPAEILLGTRNGAQHLPDQLGSYLKQTHPHWRLRISDDASTDGSLDVVQGFAAANPGRTVTVLNGPAQGAAQNYLSLLQLAADDPAPVTTLSDQDDVWMKERLVRAVTALSDCREDQPALYAANTVLVTEDLSREIPQRVRGNHLGFGNALVQNVIAGNTIALNAAAVRLIAENRPETPVPFHDWWIYLLISGAGGRIVYDPAPCLYYRQHPGSVLGAHKGAAPAAERLRLVMSRTYQAWIDRNLSALDEIRDVLTDANRQRLDAFCAARARRGLRNLGELTRIGVRRDTAAGTLLIGVLHSLGRL